MEGARSTWRGGSQYPQTPRDAPQVRATGSFLSSAVLQRCRRHFGRFSPRLGPCAGGHEVKTTPSGPLLGLFSAGTLARSVSGSARILRTAMSRRPIFPRQPGRTRHAGPGRLRGARENAAHRARRPKSAQRQKKKENCAAKERLSHGPRSAQPLAAQMRPVVWQRRGLSSGRGGTMGAICAHNGRAEPGQRARCISLS